MKPVPKPLLTFAQCDKCAHPVSARSAAAVDRALLDHLVYAHG